MDNILLKIIDTIKSSFKSIYGFNYLLLDNISTINHLYDNTVSKIIFYHNISKNVINEIIDNMIKENINIVLLSYQNDINIKWIEEYYIIKITFTTNEIFSRGETINNIYYSITDDKLIYFENDFIFIDDNKNFILELSYNNMKFLDIIKYYLITNEECLKNTFFEVIASSDLNKFNLSNNSFFIEYLDFLANINDNKFFDRFILFINDVPEFNKILFGNKEFIFFENSFKNPDFDTYLKLLLINKIEFITKNYINYIKNINELNDFEMLSEDKLLIYRKLKKQRRNLDIIPENLKLITKNTNTFYIMMKILFYVPPNNLNIETLKLAYIYKCFNQKDINEIRINLELYNRVLEIYNLENKVKEDDYIYRMLSDNYLCKYEYNNYIKIPEVYKKLQYGEDKIDIYDFQDAFVLVYEYVYLNKFNFTSYEQSKEICDDLINSVLCSIRANKLISNVNEVEYCSNESLNNFENVLNNVLFQIDYNNINNEIITPDDNDDNNDKKQVNEDDKLNKKFYKKKYEQKKEKYKKMKNIIKIIKNNYFDIELIKNINIDNRINIISEYYNLIITENSLTDSEDVLEYYII